MGRIRHLRLAIPVLAGACWMLAQTPSFRVDVKLVRLLATVKDASGAPVSSLDKEDFTVLERGVPQTISVFDRYTSQPLSIALLVDTSGSTGKELRYEVDSVNRFVRSLFKGGNPEDALSLFSFNWEVRRLAPFTRSADRLEKALKSLRGEAGTSMYDAIYLAAEELEKRDGRRVMVMVTDGGDTVSSKGYHDALRSLHNVDAVFYSILVTPVLNDPGRNRGGENALATLSSSTGGRVFQPTLGEKMDTAFDEILRDLRTQYLLGYYPKNVPLTREEFHRVEVRVNRPDLRVVTRNGYYGDFDSAAASPERPLSIPNSNGQSKDQSSGSDTGRKPLSGSALERKDPGPGSPQR